MTNIKTDQLYSSSTLYTLGGASTGVWLLTSVISKIFSLEDLYVRLVGLGTALFLAYLGAMNINKKLTIHLITLSFFNGLLIYVTSSGINSINQGIETEKNETNTKQLAFFSSIDNTIWWTPIKLKNEISLLNDSNTIKNERLRRQQTIIDSLKKEVMRLESLSHQIDTQKSVHTPPINQNPISTKDTFNKNPQKNTPSKKIKKNEKKTDTIPKYERFKRDQYFGIIKGKDTIIAPVFTSIMRYRPDSIDYFVVSKEYKWGILDSNGNYIIKCRQKSKNNAINSLKFIQSINEKNPTSIGL